MGLLDTPQDVSNCRRCEFDPKVEKMPWIGNGNPLQYSGLEKFMDREGWRATVHGVAESGTTEQLCAHTHTHTHTRAHTHTRVTLTCSSLRAEL